MVHVIPEDVSERVNSGASLLDTFSPGWWKLVDVRELSMNSCKKCMLGQLYGDYVDGLTELMCSVFASFPSEELNRREFREGYGFDREIYDRFIHGEHGTYATLRAAWINEIEARIALDDVSCI